MHGQQHQWGEICAGGTLVAGRPGSSNQVPSPTRHLLGSGPSRSAALWGDVGSCRDDPRPRRTSTALAQRTVRRSLRWRIGSCRGTDAR